MAPVHTKNKFLHQHIKIIKVSTDHTNVSNLLEAVEDKDDDLEKAESEHEEGRRKARILVLVGVLVGDKEVNSLPQKLPESFSSLTSKAQVLPLDKGQELIIINDTIIVEINLKKLMVCYLIITFNTY